MKFVENMKNLLLSIFLFVTIFCNGQVLDTGIDFDYFLLGTTNDYMGRDNYKKIADRIDEYSQHDKALVCFLDSVFRDKYPDLTISTNKKNGKIGFWSKDLAQKINDFYFYEASRRGIYMGEVDLSTVNIDSLLKTSDYKEKLFEPVYTGRLRDDIFKSKIEKKSFIAGVYKRFGSKRDSLFSISIPNSISKVALTTELLKDLQCTDVEYIVLKDFIPSGHIVYFTPTDELESYLNAINQMIGPSSTQVK